MKLTQGKAFRNSYLAALFLLITCTASAQVYDSSQLLQQINAYGYDYKNVQLRDGGKFRLPRNPPAAMAFRDSGSVAYRNGKLSVWDGRKWQSYRTTVLPGTVTVDSVGIDSVRLNVRENTIDSLIALAFAASGLLDSATLRNDSLFTYTGGVESYRGKVSGGGGGGTLQEAFDADPAAVPQILGSDEYGNLKMQFQFLDGVGTANFVYLGNTDGAVAVTGVEGQYGSFANAVLYAGNNLGAVHSVMTSQSNLIINSSDEEVYLTAPLSNNQAETDSSLVIETSGKIKKAAKASGGSGITTAQLTDSLNTREPRYKFRNDSTGNAGYTTLYQNGLKANTASPTFTGTVTLPTTQATGRTALQGVTINKDSLPITTTNRWAVTIDTPTSRLQRYDLENKADTFNQTFTGRNTFTSTTSGLIIPRVTTAQMNAITGATQGEIVYNTDEGVLYNFTTDWGWISETPEWKRRNGVEQFSEFIIQPTATNMQTDFFTTVLANSGTIGSATAVSNRPGIYQLSTSTSSTARSSLLADATNATNILLGGGQLMFETDVRIPTLSNSTETFRFFVGLTSNTQYASVTSVAFLYDSSGATEGSAASGNWQVVCANASTRSYTTTSVPVVAGQWYRLKAIVNADRTSVQFYIDGTLVRTETNNIPTTGITPAVVLTKSNGTTARTALIDWFFLKQKFTTPR